MVRLPEEAKEVAQYLLSRYWVHKTINEDMFRLAKKHYDALNRFFASIGLTLIRPLNPECIIKVDKLPAKGLASHGIEAFKRPLDYVFFCATLAYFEDTTATYLLFPGVVEEIQRYMPPTGAAYPRGFDTAQYDCRLSVIRVFRYLLRLGVLTLKEGEEIERYGDNPESEGLYWVLPGYQHIMRNFLSATLTRFRAREEFVEAEAEEMAKINDRDDPDQAVLIRNLLTIPCVWEQDQSGSTWDLVDMIEKEATDRDPANKIYDQLAAIEENLNLTLERYDRGAALVAYDYTQNLNLFFGNEREGMAQLTLLFASLVKQKFAEKKLHQNKNGTIEMPRSEYINLLNEFYDEHHLQWSSNLRTNWYKGIDRATSSSGQFTNYLRKWRMLDIERKNDTEWVVLYPFLVRNLGEYGNGGASFDEI